MVSTCVSRTRILRHEREKLQREREALRGPQNARRCANQHSSVVIEQIKRLAVAHETIRLKLKARRTIIFAIQAIDDDVLSETKAQAK